MNTSENIMMMTVLEVDIESWLRRPAVTSRREMYLIDGKKLIGKVRMTAGRGSKFSDRYESVSIHPEDQSAEEYLKEYEKFWIGDMFFLKFDGIFGYIRADQEIDDDLMIKSENLRVVDRFEFDFGICHPFFSDVEGFDSYHKEQNKLRIHTKHKARRPRNSHKIKKIK